MGSHLKLNDTLQITHDQGFPCEILDLEKHQKDPIKLENLENKVFSWKGKSDARIYHPAPCRCFLVESRDGKWIYWGHVIVLEQIIQYDESTGTHTTSGTYKIESLYDPEYQQIMGKHETPDGKNYFS